MTEITAEADIHAGIQFANGFPRYSSREIDWRHDALRGLMSDHGLDAIVVGGAAGLMEQPLQYFTNWQPLADSFLLLPQAEDPIMFVRLWNHLPDARRIAAIDDIRFGGDSAAENIEALAGGLVNTGNPRRVGLIGPFLHDDVLQLSRYLPHSEWVNLASDYIELRRRKSAEEMEYVRIAADLGDRAVAALERETRTGMCEYELAGIIEDAYLRRWGTNLAHFTLTTPMASPEFCVPHQSQPNRVISSGDVMVTEISVLFWGYAGQILRTLTVDSSPTPLYKDLHDVAEQAYREITGRLHAGATVGDVLDAAECIDSAGFTIWDDLVHGFVGGYLPPIVRTRQSRGASLSDDHTYVRDEVVVVQPNVITPDGRAGVQLGNAVRVTDQGVETLQKHPTMLLSAPG